MNEKYNMKPWDNEYEMAKNNYDSFECYAMNVYFEINSIDKNILILDRFF